MSCRHRFCFKMAVLFYKTFGVVDTGRSSIWGIIFSLGLHPSLVTLDTDCNDGGDMARAGADDIFAVRLPEVVFHTAQKFTNVI